MIGGVKRKYRLIDFKRTKTDVSAEVIRNEYDPNNQHLFLLLNMMMENIHILYLLRI